MRKTLLDKVLLKVPNTVKALVEKQYDVAEQISSILGKKGLKHKDLVELSGKKPSYISRVLGGVANMTLKTIVELEDALGEKILVTPMTVEQTKFEVIIVSEGKSDTEALEDYYPFLTKIKKSAIILSGQTEYFSNVAET